MAPLIALLVYIYITWYDETSIVKITLVFTLFTFMTVLHIGTYCMILKN